MREGRPLREAYLSQRPSALSNETRLPQRQRKIRAHLMGLSARNDHRQAEGDYGAKSSVHSSLQLRRHHGPPAGRKYGSAILSSALSIIAGLNDQLDSRQVPHAIH